MSLLFLSQRVIGIGKYSNLLTKILHFLMQIFFSQKDFKGIFDKNPPSFISIERVKMEQEDVKKKNIHREHIMDE